MRSILPQRFRRASSPGHPRVIIVCPPSGDQHLKQTSRPYSRANPTSTTPGSIFPASTLPMGLPRPTLGTSILRARFPTLPELCVLSIEPTTPLRMTANIALQTLYLDDKDLIPTPIPHDALQYTLHEEWYTLVRQVVSRRMTAPPGKPVASPSPSLEIRQVSINSSKWFRSLLSRSNTHRFWTYDAIVTMPGLIPNAQESFPHSYRTSRIMRTPPTRSLAMILASKVSARIFLQPLGLYSTTGSFGYKTSRSPFPTHPQVAKSHHGEPPQTGIYRLAT